jgi:mycothiol synthase
MVSLTLTEHSAKRVLSAAARRARWLWHGRPAPETLLEMIWPTRLLSSPPEVRVAAGYRLRQFASADTDAFQGLLNSAGMPPCPLEYWERYLLPNGFFVIEHEATKKLVATCFASHHSTDRHPRAGNFGWLAADPQHSGKHLGRTVASAVTARLISAGYERIYLETHDHRLQAIRIYLSMGWIPLLYTDQMAQRWQSICGLLDWPYTPESWPT